MKFALILISIFFGSATFAKKSPSQLVSGVYWVPVNSALESRYAVFGLSDVEVRRSGNEVRLRYPLPRELTGADNVIELKGLVEKETNVLQLDGPLGFGECPSADQLQNCSITYRNLKLDPTARTELLRQISRTPTELELREKVAASFCLAASGGEPCGFLSVGY